MTEILASFCNIGRSFFRFALGRFQDDGESLRFVGCIDLAPIAARVGERTGITGLAQRNGTVYVAIQGQPPVIAAFDRDGEVTLHPLATVSQVHSLVAVPGALLIVSTGTNSVVRLDLATGIETEVYRIDASAVDVVHLNGLAIDGDAPVACMMGHHRRDAPRVGELRDLASGQTLYGGLRSPHSVVSADGALFVLESGTGVLFRHTRGRTTNGVLSCSGLVRGLAFTGDRTLIGRSGFRLISASKGKRRARPIAMSEAEVHSCGIYAARDRRFAGFTDISGIAPEIYDILTLEPASTGPAALPLTDHGLLDVHRALQTGADADAAAAGLADPAISRTARLMMAEAKSDWPAATALATEVAEADPTNLASASAQVRLFEAAGRTKGALRAARRAAQLAPADGLVLGDLGRLATATGAYDEAVAAMRARLPVVSDVGKGRVALARALALAGDAASARDMLAEACRLDPTINPKSVLQLLAHA